jgi:hypothetical protein
VSVEPGKTPVIGVIIPVYKQPELLPESVLSVIAQDLVTPARIVLVNDGCPWQATDANCRTLQQSWPDRILYVRQPNKGLAAARNTGIDVALLAWPEITALFFLDADNRLSPATLRRLYKKLEDSGADWAFPDLNLVGMPGHFGMAGAYSVLEHILGNISDAGSLVSRAVFAAGVRFDESMRLGLEDWEFWLQAVAGGFRGCHAPHAGFRYRRRPESLLSTSIRHGAEIESGIRRKHRKWVHPRACVRLEHEEAPRFAILTPESGQVALATDPRCRQRTLPLDRFLERLRLYIAHDCLRALPGYVVVTSDRLLQALDQARASNSMFWHAQRACERGAPAILFSDAGGRPALMSGLLTTATNAKPHPGALMWIVSIEHLVKGGAASAQPTLYPIAPAHISLSELPGLEPSSVVFESIGDGLRAWYQQAVVPKQVRLYSSGRRKSTLSSALADHYGCGALFPLAGAEPRLGILAQRLSDVRLAEVKAARGHGFSTHLYVAAHCAIPDSAVLRSCFDTISRVPAPAEEFGTSYFGSPLVRNSHPDANAVIGALSLMNVVLNEGCSAFLPMAGRLRTMSCRVLYSARTSSDEEAKAELHPAYAALAYEHAIDGLLVSSDRVKYGLWARGFPAAKLFLDLITALKG